MEGEARWTNSPPRGYLKGAIMALSSDGKWLALGGQREVRPVVLLDAQEGKEAAQIEVADTRR